MTAPSTIKAAAALAEFAAHAAQTIASGKQIDEYTLAMIQNPRWRNRIWDIHMNRPRLITHFSDARPFAARANAIEHSHPAPPSRWSRLFWVLCLGWVR